MAKRVVARNKKAKFNYEILDKYEAGIVLLGSEVKALRAGRANLGDSFLGLREFFSKFFFKKQKRGKEKKEGGEGFWAPLNGSIFFLPS